MNKIAASPIKKWQSLFEEQPLEALDRLLLGRAYLGVLNRNDTNEILYRLFHTQSRARLSVLDQAVRDWFIKYWETRPAAVSIQRWNEILRNAFSTVIRLNLSETQQWLFENYQRARVWLHSLYLGPDSDPEAALLRLLALSQRDQSLLPLWMRLCRLEEDRPLHFADIGLLGLQKLPEVNGEPHGDIHPAVFSGIVDLARAIDKRVRFKNEGKEFWLLKVRAIMARYPRSPQYWTEHFLPLLPSDPNSTESKWLGQLIPKIKQDCRTSRKAAIASTKDLVMPSYQEFGVIRNLIEKCSLEDIRPKLETFLKKHENYALKTGFADILVKVFSEVAYKILSQDREWSLFLIEKAFQWAPFNFYLWNERAIIESRFGRNDKAIELLWEAKRKFPEIPDIRNNLATLLRKEGKNRIAEIVYRQTIEDFISDEFCRNGLADVLRAQGRLDEAEAIYRQTMQDFPRDEVCRNGLAEVLRAQGRWQEAEVIYRQAMKDFPTDEVCRNGLANMLRAQGRLEEAEVIYSQTMKDFPNDAVCYNSLADMLRAQGRLEEAEAIYRQTIKDFPASDEGQEIEKVSMENILVSEEKSEQVMFELPTNGNGSWETELGLANLYRLASRRSKGTEKEQYALEFKKACEAILAEQPNNIYALLEQGFWLLEQDAQNAKQYFVKYSSNGDNTHVLGFRIGYILAKTQQSEQVTPAEWKELMADFSNRKLLIAYENVSHELNKSNGKMLSMLESLRKEMQIDLDALPATLRENEKWLRSSLSERLFKGINLKNPIIKADLPKILKNHAQNKPILQGIIEQSLVNF